jgi:integrase
MIEAIAKAVAGKTNGRDDQPMVRPTVRETVQAHGGERNKRPFTEKEMRASLGGKADHLMQDASRIAALSEMRRGEIFALQVRDVSGGMFDIDQAKSAAGVRKLPIRFTLQPIIARITKGRGTEDLLIQAPGQDSGDASGKRFGTCRTVLGVVDKAAGRRQERIDFHSFRLWFTTPARVGFDRGMVAAIVGHENGNVTDDV